MMRAPRQVWAMNPDAACGGGLRAIAVAWARKRGVARAIRVRRAGAAAQAAATSGAPRRCPGMAKPWTRKNPLLSLWLSAANAWAGAARGVMSAAAQRQARKALRPKRHAKPKRI